MNTNQKNRKLYIAPLIPINSLEDLINCLYTDNYKQRKRQANPTYQDKNLKVIECAATRRSFEDLLALSRTYFPLTTEKDLMSTLINLEITFIYCGDIFKIVFMGLYGLRIEDLESTVLSPGEDYDYSDEELEWADNTYTQDVLINIYNQL